MNCEHRLGACAMHVHLHCVGCDDILYMEGPDGLGLPDGARHCAECEDCVLCAVCVRDADKCGTCRAEAHVA